MASELQRIARELVAQFNRVPAIVAELYDAARMLKQHAELVEAMTHGSADGRQVAVQLGAAAAACKRAADTVQPVQEPAVEWAKRFADGSRTAGGPGTDTVSSRSGDAASRASGVVRDGARRVSDGEHTPRDDAELLTCFERGRVPRASELRMIAGRLGWEHRRAQSGPSKYIDANGYERLVIKKGSSRTPGSEHPHVTLRDSSGYYIDRTGTRVSRRDPANHTAIEWDIDDA